MLFTSFQYAGFLALVLAVYWSLPGRWRPVVLLVASYAFYASWYPSLLILLVAVTVIVWASARAIPGSPRARQRLLVTVAVVVAIGVLALFKLLKALGDISALPVSEGFAAVLPVGLSFFTFYAISYVVDVYRGQREPDSLPDVALYITFFPHLLAGPIVRAKRLIPAFHSVTGRPDPVQWAEGGELILFGVFKKVVLADPLISRITTMAATPDSFTTANALVASVGGVVAAYFDINAYIDIARGSAKLLGIDMPRNALSPLLRSTGYADFWRRWQLTVMMWFRDYIYRPIRGTGKGRRDTFALFCTFAVLGIWHGFSAGWVLWGLASGVIIVVERNLQSRRAAENRRRLVAARRKGKRPPRPVERPRWVQLLTTYALVWLTLPLIAAESIRDVPDLYRIFLDPRGGPTDWDLIILTVGAVLAVFALDGREDRREARSGRRDPLTPLRVTAYAIAVVGIVVFAGADAQPFLYFQY